MSANSEHVNESTPSIEECNDTIRPAGFTDETAAEYEEWCEERRAEGQTTEDADADERAARFEASQRGGKILYRLTADNCPPTWECSYCAPAAIRKAQLRGWAVGKIVAAIAVEIDGEPVAGAEAEMTAEAWLAMSHQQRFEWGSRNNESWRFWSDSAKSEWIARRTTDALLNGRFAPIVPPQRPGAA